MSLSRVLRGGNFSSLRLPLRADPVMLCSFSWERVGTRLCAMALALASTVSAASGCGSMASGSDAGGSPAGPIDGGDASNSDASSSDASSSDASSSDASSSDASSSDVSNSDASSSEISLPGDSTGTAAIAAAQFLGSIGVCTHIGQGVDAPAASATAMSFAGIRNLRDDGNPAHVSDWISMHASSGIRTCVLTNQDVAGTVSIAEELNAAGALLAVEGPNEPNNFPVTYQGQKSDSNKTFMPVAELQRDLYAAVKADAKLTGIPVFHSSEAGGAEPDDVGLQFLTIPNGAGIAMPDGTRYADYGNTHNYVCGHSSKLVDNVAWSASDPTLNGDWDGPYVEYGHTWHGGFAGYPNAALVGLPKVTTETGWVTAGPNAITQEQQARLFLNLYLSAFKRGFSYTFIYMLRDDPNQGDWGLFDVSYNPKTSGNYLHNLTTILADTDATTTRGKLGYSIAVEPVTVHDILLQKSNGLFELVVWDERPSGGSDTVNVDFAVARSTIKVYDPTTGTAPSESSQSTRSVQLTLSDHPMVIEVGL
jgi:hypothetical protein